MAHLRLDWGIRGQFGTSYMTEEQFFSAYGEVDLPAERPWRSIMTSVKRPPGQLGDIHHETFFVTEVEPE